MAEPDTLQSAKSAAVHDLRLADRDAEFRHRILELELAAEGIPPIGPTPQAPVYGSRSFVALMADIDSDAVKHIVRDIHHTGYGIVPNLFGQETIERLRAGMAHLFESSRQLFRTFQHVSLDINQTVHIQNVLAKTDVADEVATNPFLRSIVSGVLGYDFILNAGAVAMSPDPGCNPQGLHRDDGFYALLPRPHMPLVLTAAIALDDFTTANGGTHLVPESCCWPEARLPEDSEIIQCEMSAGSMLIWDGAIYHGGGGNETAEQTRRTLTLNYTRGWLRGQFNQYLSVPRQRVLDMPAELQRDLGYHRSALGLGGCDNQDPLDYLQRMAGAGGDGTQSALGRETGRDFED